MVYTTIRVQKSKGPLETALRWLTFREPRSGWFLVTTAREPDSRFLRHVKADDMGQEWPWSCQTAVSLGGAAGGGWLRLVWAGVASGWRTGHSEGSTMTKTTTAETKKIKIAPTNANIVKITVQQVGDGCVWGGASINTWWCEYWWCKYWCGKY